MISFSDYQKYWVEVYPMTKDGYVDFSRQIKNGWYLYKGNSQWMKSSIKSDMSEKFSEKVQVIVKSICGGDTVEEPFSDKKIIRVIED